MRGTGNRDTPLFQPVLYGLDDVLVVFGAGEPPRVRTFGAADELQLSQDAPCLQFRQQVVPEIRNKENAGSLSRRNGVDSA